MKEEELCYEWVLFWSNFIGGRNKNGFFDDNKIYEKKGWLDWKVYRRRLKQYELHKTN